MAGIFDCRSTLPVHRTFRSGLFLYSSETVGRYLHMANLGVERANPQGGTGIGFPKNKAKIETGGVFIPVSTCPLDRVRVVLYNYSAVSYG